MITNIELRVYIHNVLLRRLTKSYTDFQIFKQVLSAQKLYV